MQTYVLIFSKENFKGNMYTFFRQFMKIIFFAIVIINYFENIQVFMPKLLFNC